MVKQRRLTTSEGEALKVVHEALVGARYTAHQWRVKVPQEGCDAIELINRITHKRVLVITVEQEE